MYRGACRRAVAGEEGVPVTKPLPDAVETILAEAKTIAVLGAHVDPNKAAHYVPDYLADRAYRILPVNPVFAGRELWGETVVASLEDLTEPIDVVDVFRRSAHLPGHLDELLAIEPPPRWIWFQLGIRNDEVARRLEEAGIGVVQDRCLLADHRAWVAAGGGGNSG